MKTLFDRLDEATARLDQVICIAGAISAGEAIPTPLIEFLEEDDRTLAKCLGKLPKWLTEQLETSSAGEYFAEWALQEGRLGFLVNIATPVMKHHGDSSSYSWGYYCSRWVYGDTFEAAVAAGLEWVAGTRKAEKAKASGKSAGKSR